MDENRTLAPTGYPIVTGSLRRKAQLLHLRPDVEIVPLRGNLDTRLHKLTEENLYAIILGTAGLRRLGRAGGITAVISETQMLPAILARGLWGWNTRRRNRRPGKSWSFWITRNPRWP